MRKIVFAAFAALLGFLAPAQVVTDCEAGQLSSRIEDCSITQLQVSGHIDARDFRFIADSLRHLTALDLSAATIDAYRGKALFANVTDYAAGEVPCLSLASMLELARFALPNDATRLGDGCLLGCTRLTDVQLGNQLTHIGDYAFSGCEQLVQLHVPQSLARMGEGAFSNCPSLASVETASDPDGGMAAALYIGRRAFANCPSLARVLPGKVLSGMDAEAFAATGLQELNLGNQAIVTALPDWVLAESALGQLTLPPSVQTIGDGALMGVETLSQLTLPATVNYIGSHAMAYMTGLQQLDCQATDVPTLGDSVWYGVDQSTVKLHVSPQSLADYRGAAQWCNFMMVSLQPGDVNADGLVDIADVNIVINCMLGKDSADNYDGRAYLTEGDLVVDIADVNASINYMLGRKRALRLAAQPSQP